MYDMCHYMDTIRTERATVDITPYLPYVHEIAKRVCSHIPPGMAFDDLMSYGTLGLIDAAQRFDPSKGCLFWTFAELRVWGGMGDGIRKWHQVHHRRKDGISLIPLSYVEGEAHDTLSSLWAADEEEKQEKAAYEALLCRVWEAVDLLPHHLMLIMRAKYEHGLPWSLIQSLTGRSVSRLIRDRNLALQSLRLAFSDNKDRSSSDMAGSAPRHFFGGAGAI